MKGLKAPGTTVASWRSGMCWWMDGGSALEFGKLVSLFFGRDGLEESYGLLFYRRSWVCVREKEGFCIVLPAVGAHKSP